MKLFVCRFVMVLGLLTASVRAQEPRDLAALAWMTGSWADTVNGLEMEEHWTLPKGGTMIGLHRDVRGGKTVLFEFLRIEARGDGIYYVASPNGAAPTSFKLAETAPNRVIFANPQHDFPQRIIYWLDSGDLRARVEGLRQGKTVGQEWRWKKR